jgi:hypothetical protein
MSQEWMHMALQAAEHQIKPNSETSMPGYVDTYDPTSDTVTVLILERVGPNGEPFITGPIPVGRLAVGGGWGFQWAPSGGATMDNPQQGEQCTVVVWERNNGLFAQANFYYTDDMKPPGAGTGSDTADDPDGTNKLQPTEWIFKHNSGTFLKQYQDGHIQIYVADKAVIRVQKDCDLTVIEGDLNVDVQQGNATVLVEEGDLIATATEGDIAITATAETIALSAGTNVTINATANVNVTGATITATAGTSATVTAPVIELSSAVVNAGLGPVFQALLNTAALATINSHTHVVIGSVTGPPVEQLVIGVDTTVDTFAS